MKNKQGGRGVAGEAGGHVTGYERPGRHYQTGDLTKTLGVSRTSLTYYEQAGLVTPRRNPETGVREYDNNDVFDLFQYLALGNLGLTARQVAERAMQEEDLFGERSLEGYLRFTSDRISYYEALRDAIDRMRAIRMRDRLGPLVQEEWVERFIFVEDGAEGGYIDLRSNRELDLLASCFPIAGFGIRYGLGDDGKTTWRWGRTVPVRHASVAGIRWHVPEQVGGCSCLTMIGRTPNESTPLPAHVFDPLYRRAAELGRQVAGDPFVPYIFPPHVQTPYLVCLPLEE